MKLRKSTIVILGLFVVCLSSLTTSAVTITDITGDVYYGSGASYNLASQDKPNVDLTGITFNEDDTTATITMTVNGVIDVSEDTMYWATYAVGEEAAYIFTYSNGSVIGIASTGTGGSFEANASVSGDTLTVEFESLNINTDDGELYGYAATWIEGTAGSGEMWMDYAPGSYAPWYGMDGNGNGDDTGNGDTGDGDDGGNGDTGTGGTPGFEMFIVIAALGLAFILLRRRK